MEGLFGAARVSGSGRRGSSATGNLRGYDINKGIYRKEILTLLYRAGTKMEAGQCKGRCRLGRGRGRFRGGRGRFSGGRGRHRAGKQGRRSRWRSWRRVDCKGERNG